MRRVVVPLLVALVLGVVAWLAWRPQSEPVAPTRSLEAQTRVEIDELAESESIENDERRVAADAQAPAVEPAHDDGASVLAADPTEEELQAFARACPPGTIEGIVLRGKTPVAGGSAWLGPQSTGGLPWGPPEVWNVAPGVVRADIDAGGVFRFENLLSEAYAVGVQTPDGETRHVYVEFAPHIESQRLRIVLGTGGIRGHVFDERGAPCAGWQVAVFNWGTLLADVQVIDGRETDARGAFSVGGLVGGSYVVSAGPVADRSDPRTRTVYVELPPGEWKSVDVGTRAGGCIWTGRVLTPRGEPLALTALTEVRVNSTHAQERVALSAGVFQIRVEAGTYDVSLFAYSRTGGQLVPLGNIALPERELQQDLRLPRALVRVRATHRGTKPGSARFMGWLGSAELGTRSSLPDADGNECFLAIPPGEYALTCSPSIEGAPQGTVVKIGANDDEVEVDVVLGDP
jgi:hypothetical protein